MAGTESFQRAGPTGASGGLSIRAMGERPPLAERSDDEIDYSDIPELPDELLKEAQPFDPGGQE